MAPRGKADDVPFRHRRLMDAKTASERMDALCEFIEYWLGPRKKSYGETARELRKHRLPMPLKRLYEFAGRWPRWDRATSKGHDVPVFSFRDRLLSVSSLQHQEDEKIAFAFGDEVEGTWDCRTLVEGIDPPVWRFGPVWDGLDYKWVRIESDVCDSLSRFLVTFVLRQLTVGAIFHMCDWRLCQRLGTDPHTVTIWENGPYVHSSDAKFSVYKSVLIDHSRPHLATQQQEAREFLLTNQSPIDDIQISMGSGLKLQIRMDGSAKINSSIEVASGALSFQEILQMLIRADSDLPSPQNPEVLFFRGGQSTGVRPKHLRDKNLLAPLFLRVFENARSAHAREAAAALMRRFIDEFGSVALDFQWLNSNVVKLARAIKRERAFDRLPILADALMDADCDNAVILDHCRSAESHVGSCWVVDLLLKRKL